jgi:DNA-binding response OmpR family regulator
MAGILLIFFDAGIYSNERQKLTPTDCVLARQDIKPLTILHVEDEENDALLLTRACERAGLPVQLHHVLDGDVARSYLLGEGEFSNRETHPLPHVIVLDLKMPRTDGFEFLRWLRGQQGFAELPVLVFTSSLSREDKARALSDGASSYFVKPATFEALVNMVEAFKFPTQMN